MKYQNFLLEEYFAPREFKLKYMLSSSDSESIVMKDLIHSASKDLQTLWENLTLGYTESSGHPLLKHEISKLYDASFEQSILVCAGAEEGIFSLTHTLLSSNDHCVVVVPCYQSLRSLPEALCEVSTVPLHEKNGWRLDLEELEKAVKSNTKLIIINFPHNPTGATLTVSEQHEIIRIARKSDAYIFSDEVYRFLEYDALNVAPPIASVYEKGISLEVMSKSFGLAGLRIGWITSKDRTVIKNAEKIKLYLSICNSAPSEILSIMALQQKDALINRNRTIALQNLDEADSFFKKHPDIIAWSKPKAGCIAFPSLLVNDTSDTFAELLESESVLLLPGSVYSWGSQHFRFGYGRLNFKEAFTLFCKKLKELYYGKIV
jgi:aspartate/methionine/tyrosine aminotransferase